MGAAHCPMRCGFFSLYDFIFDGAVNIGECHSEHGDQLFETHPIGGHSPTEMMADTLGRDEFIYDRKIALIEGFIKNAADNGSALSS